MLRVRNRTEPPALTVGMGKDTDKAAEYRRQAVLCLEVAERMSLRDDRARMIQMAQHWLELAQRAEAAGE